MDIALRVNVAPTNRHFSQAIARRVGRPMISPLRAVLLSLGLMTFAALVTAQEIPGYPTSFLEFDPRETAMLPPYCRYTFYFRDKLQGGQDQVEKQRWISVLGPTFLHLHHYCFGIMKSNRANLLARDFTVRRFYLSDAVTEFDYVIDRSPDDFVLLPEILNKKGENLIRLNRVPVAQLVLQRSIDLKPDYWPPYAQLSDYFKSQGDTAAARQWLERALVASPDAPALLRRMNELGASAKLTPSPIAKSP